MFYLLIFIFSAIIFKTAQAKYYKRDFWRFYVMCYVAILWLSLWAGLRDVRIGTDVLFYAVDVFKDASKSVHPIEDAFSDFGWIEPFYFLTNYLASIIGGIGFSLFLVMFIQLAFAFHGLRFFMDKAPLWVMMLAYLFLFYNLSLNLMRQSIPMAIGVYSLRYIEKRSIYKLLVMAAFAFFWHKSSIVLFLFLILLYFYKGINQKLQLFLLILSIPVLIMLFSAFLPILQWVIGSYELMSQYQNYGGETGNFESNLSSIDIGSRFMMLVLVLWMRVRKVSAPAIGNIILLILFCDIVAKFLGVYTYFATRISYYFIALEIPYLFMILNSKTINVKTRFVSNIILLFSFAFMSFWENIHFGFNETYPYISKILDITLY